MKTLRNLSLLLAAASVFGAGAATSVRLAQVVRRADAGASPKAIVYAGTVVDADGKPVAGAIVECRQTGRGLTGKSSETEVHVTTGTNGSFELQGEAIPTVLVAHKPGLAFTWNQYYNPTQDLLRERLVLTRPATLAGTVVDEADKPVSNAEVWVGAAYLERETPSGGRTMSYLSGKAARTAFSTRTTGDGRFRFEDFPADVSADLAVRAPGKVLREAEREYRGPDTMLCHSGQQDVKLVVEPAGSIEGKVLVQESGRPLAGAELSLEAGRRGFFLDTEREPARSGEDGKFRLEDVAPGTYVARAKIGTNALPEWVAESLTVVVEAGRATRDAEFSAVRGGFLEVSVLGKDDLQPVTKVNVNVSKSNFSSGAVSGSNGIALFRLPPGEYRVSGFMQGATTANASATVEAGVTNRAELALKAPPKITGVVRDPAGTPVPNLPLIVFPSYRANVGQVQTDENGRYEMTWSPQRFGSQDNTFYLVARETDRNLAVAVEIEEDARKLDLRLEPALAVSGRVEDAKGTPLTNATVRLFLWSANMGSQFGQEPLAVDAQGRFEIRALPPGRKYSMDAAAKGFGSANRQLQEDDSGTNRVELEPFVLPVADRLLAGQVLDGEDKPVARVRVSIYGQGQPNDSARTDDQGRFVFEHVCEGSIQLYANAQRASGNARAEGGDTNVVLKLGVTSPSSVSEAPKRASLVGKPLPDLAPFAVSAEAAPPSKPIVLCLFDHEQRPSRRFVRQLAERNEALQKDGVTVLGLQAAIASPESLKEWKDANPLPFPVGRLAEKSAQTKWVSDLESLPWLILTDKDRKVVAEGFPLDELDSKLKASPK